MNDSGEKLTCERLCRIWWPIWLFEERKSSLREHDRSSRRRRRKGRSDRQRSTRRRSLGPSRRPSGRATCPRASPTATGGATHCARALTATVHSERLSFSLPYSITPTSSATTAGRPATTIDDDVVGRHYPSLFSPVDPAERRQRRRRHSHRTRDVYGHVYRQNHTKHHFIIETSFFAWAQAGGEGNCNSDILLKGQRYRFSPPVM